MDCARELCCCCCLLVLLCFLFAVCCFSLSLFLSMRRLICLPVCLVECASVARLPQLVEFTLSLTVDDDWCTRSLTRFGHQINLCSYFYLNTLCIVKRLKHTAKRLRVGFGLLVYMRFLYSTDESFSVLLRFRLQHWIVLRYMVLITTTSHFGPLHIEFGWICVGLIFAPHSIW